MAKKRAVKGKAKDTGRKPNMNVSTLNTENIEYVDWKDVNLLRRFISDRAKVRARRVTGNNVQQQREVARAIKNAREMALIPYSNRVTTQRGRRGDRGDRGERGERSERPQPAQQSQPASGGEATSEFQGLEGGQAAEAAAPSAGGTQ